MITWIDFNLNILQFNVRIWQCYCRELIGIWWMWFEKTTAEKCRERERVITVCTDKVMAKVNFIAQNERKLIRSQCQMWLKTTLNLNWIESELTSPVSGFVQPQANESRLNFDLKHSNVIFQFALSAIKWMAGTIWRNRTNAMMNVLNG